MKGYFPVSLHDSSSSHESMVDYQFLFKAPGRVSPSDLADCITSGLRKVLFPDALILVVTPDEFDEVYSALEGDDGVIEALNRASTRVCIAISKLDQYARIASPKALKNSRGEFPLFKSGRTHEIYEEGLRSLFEGNGVCVTAPPGFCFVKPSGDRSLDFIRAEEALYEVEQVQFLASAVLNRMSRTDGFSPECIEVIYIDSMVISSVAYALRDLLAKLHKCIPPRVVSFHSYGGIKSVQKPSRGTSLCLISASSSMSMQREWIKETFCDVKDVITLVTFADAKDGDMALCRIKRPDRASSKSHLSKLRDLKILGERFSPEDTPIKEVLLRGKVHGVTDWRKIAPLLSTAGVIKVLSKEEGVGSARPVYANGKSLITVDAFRTWFLKKIKHTVPISLKTIIYQDDESSYELAKIRRPPVFSSTRL